jgi:hypothetical protein
MAQLFVAPAGMRPIVGFLLTLTAGAALPVQILCEERTNDLCVCRRKLRGQMPQLPAGLEMTGDENNWGTVGAAGIGAVVGIIGTIFTALINKQHPMAALVDAARIRLLIEGYERRINELQSEIAMLELKVEALSKEREQSRIETRLGL